MPGELAEFDDLEKSSDLRAALDRALRQLDKAHAKREDLVAAVYQAAKDAAQGFVIPPIPKPAKDKRGTSPEVAICLLADWQLGKVTPSYNSNVAAERIHRYAEKVVKLIELQRAHHPVREARIYLLGDLVEGELIFPGQAHRIDLSLYAQLFRCAELLAHVVRTIAASVEHVKVVGVIGNHGALGGPGRREMHPESNADAMAYKVARGYVQDKRVDWAETLVTDERAWQAYDEVLGRTWMLWHGDQVKGGFAGFPWYGFGKRLQGWYQLRPFDYSASGHWHQSVRFDVNAITAFGAGSTESANTYAQEYLAGGGQAPTQPLIFQGEHGITAEYKVRVGS